MLFLLLCAMAHAETGAILPDRPGLATGTHTVMPGFVYVESGYQFWRGAAVLILGFPTTQTLYSNGALLR